MTPVHAASVCTGIGGVDLGFFVRAGRGVRVRVENAKREGTTGLCVVSMSCGLSQGAQSRRARVHCNVYT